MIALLFACAPEEELDLPQLLGTIEARESSAEVWDSATYFFVDDNHMFLYMSKAEGVDCHDVAEALDGGLYNASGDGPDLLQPSGSCVLTADSTTWDDGLSVSLAEGDVTAEVALSVNCWMDGEWVVGDEGYVFDGMYWNGNPTAFSFEVQGDSAGGSFEIEMENYEGKDPYDFDAPEYPGTGKVSGAGDVKWCDEFADTPFFED
ncbi:MAG: hypothetical protein FJ102_16870 [Deltaproteobacteria bacterium]|nr:hypothetical protein [Deltaproteobacteria bacterium]